MKTALTTIIAIVALIPSGTCFAAASTLVLTPDQSSKNAEIVTRKGESAVEVRDIAGRKAWVSASLKKAPKKEQAFRQFYVNLLGNAWTEGRMPNVRITLDYLDNFHGELELKYDSTDQLYGSPGSYGVWKYGGYCRLQKTDRWKQKAFTLRDAFFGGRCNGYDIRLTTRGKGDLIISRVKIEGLPDLPRYPETTVKPNGNRKNVLMIILDDLNDHVEAFGYDPIYTPNIDRFAASGMKFMRAYCQYPVCGPSRASFLTGRYPESINVLENNMHFRDGAPDAQTMLQYFKENGYWTVGSGKIFHGLGNLEEVGASTYTHDWFLDGADPQDALLRKTFEKQHGAIKKNKNQEKWRKFRKDNWEHPEIHPKALACDFDDSLHKDVRAVKRVSEWLDAKAWGDNPFFIACGIVRPHLPFYAPRRYFNQYPKDELVFAAVPEDDWEDIPDLAYYHKHKDFEMTLGVNEPKKRAHWMQGYHASVSYADSLVGEILAALKRNGLDDDTIVVLFGDHGYTLGEHFMYGKVNMWEEVLRVPFAIRAPGVTQPGTRTKGLIELLDVYPTLCELTGLPKPAGLEGVSLRPMLNGARGAQGKETAYTVVSRYPGKTPTSRVLGRSIRDDRWRYTEWGPSRLQELYDLKCDPEQYTNLAKVAKYAEEAERLKSLLEKGRGLPFDAPKEQPLRRTNLR